MILPQSKYICKYTLFGKQFFEFFLSSFGFVLIQIFFNEYPILQKSKNDINWRAVFPFLTNAYRLFHKNKRIK